MLKIALDFDGTVVAHRYPDVGEENDKCSEILKDWVDNHDVLLILDTMRSGKELEEAVEWFKDRKIPLHGIGKDPMQGVWTDSNKAYAHLSIDDRNVGCPLKPDYEYQRMMVDWNEVKKIVEKYL